MIEWLSNLGFTPGAAGIWALVIMGFVGWWKILPGLIESITKRSIDLETRMQQSMAAYIERNDKEMEELKSDHRNCKDGQKQLEQEVSRLHDEILGLKRQIAAYQMAMVEHGLELPPATKAAMERMRIISHDN